MVLPGCANDDILNSNKPWVFPQKWSSLSAEAQALHPINLLFMNLAGVPSTDLVPLVTPCLYSWGIVKGSVVKIVKEYKVGNSMAMKTEVLVMRSKKHVFVVFRCDAWVRGWGWVPGSSWQQQPAARADAFGVSRGTRGAAVVWS
jgi:hypothetical protein